MKKFELNKDTLQKGWGGVDQYWFSLKNFNIKDESSFVDIDRPENVSKTQYYLSIGYIPYFVITNEEILRAYANSLTNKKLKLALQSLDSENYVDSFWKYINAYHDLADGLQDFEDAYVLNKGVNWCKQNNIDYSVNV